MKMLHKKQPQGTYVVVNGQESAILLQGAHVPSLVGELRSCMPPCDLKKKKVHLYKICLQWKRPWFNSWVRKIP